MTYTNDAHQRPKALKVGSRRSEDVNLIVHGQGVILFDASGACTLTFCDASGDPHLQVQFTETAITAYLKPSNEPCIDTHHSRGIVSQAGATYWVSLDSQNSRLLAGIGEARKETATYSYTFPTVSRKWLEAITTVKADSLRITRLLRDPITAFVPLLVKDTTDLTMDSIAAGTVMPKANLSMTSQRLYDCIAGPQFTLKSPDFPEFAKAIEYSIATPGKWCYETLKRKATEFDKDKPNEKETYLRITLGENNGESPGVPYVMEIWPVGHYSPIHNHGGASAVIRVLHGSINVSLFPFLSGDAVVPFTKADFKKGDITWISPTLNQVHQLKNLDTNKDTCITIQCYMYEVEDKVHYDYFDYLDASGAKQQFEPDSDMDFVKFKKQMKLEWSQRRRWWCPWV